MIENLVVYENSQFQDLYPFSILHNSWELRTGILLNFQRFCLHFNNDIYFIGRDLPLNSFLTKESINNYFRSNKNTLFLDGCLTMNSIDVQIIVDNIQNNRDIIFKIDSKIVGFYLKEINQSDLEYNNFLNLIENLENQNYLEIELPNSYNTQYLWDTLAQVPSMIVDDIKTNKNHNYFYQPQFHGVFAVNTNQIFIGDNIKIAPTVYLDASEGPIVIEDNVNIMAHSSIVGPTYIGANSTIKMGAKIYEKNLIGPWCKIGGEVENSIIHAYSNKQHEGFLGHSYIGEWVNLGADTNNSDLKNTYGKIKMRLPHKTVNTGLMFLGLMCGDHTKTAINTQFNTGTVAGISAILFESGFLSTTIPSFTWGGLKNTKKYSLDEALQTAQTMMSRRKKYMNQFEEEIFKKEFEK